MGTVEPVSSACLGREAPHHDPAQRFTPRARTRTALALRPLVRGPPSPAPVAQLNGSSVMYAVCGLPSLTSDS
jgi:hypothetical protein